jgi:TolB-like protein
MMIDTTARGMRAQLRLLGNFKLANDAGVVATITSRRARALLGYLAFAPDRSASRERLCGLLWSDRGDAQARSSLRQCILEIKTSLAPLGVDMVFANREEVALEHGCFATDIARLECAIAGNDSVAVVGQLTALGTFQLLEDQDIGGLYSEWLDQARARFEQTLASSVLGHIETCCAHEDWAAATSVADAYLQRDPLDERIVAAAIRADVAQGASASAQRRFRWLKSALSKELGVEPSALVQEAFAKSDALKTAALPASPVSSEPILAVLAFDNLSSDPEMDFFTDGISEEILQRLSRTSSLKVIARSSSFQFRGRDKITSTVSSQLGATHLLDGSVRRGGDRVRITTALVECASQTTLWSGRFDHDLADTFAVQDEIATAVADGLNLVFSPSPKTIRINPVAHDLYLRARSLAALPPHVDECIDLLSRAVELEPDFAAAWSSLAMARAVKARWMTPADQFEAKRDAGMLAAARATTLDPHAGLPLCALSLLEPDGLFAAREALLERALELAPSDPEILKQATDFASSVGRIEDSYLYAVRAAELDPLNPLMQGIRVQSKLDLGQVEGAFDDFDALRLRWPDEDWLVAMPMLVAAALGEWEVTDRLLGAPPGESREYQMARKSVELLRGPRGKLVDYARATVERQMSETGRAELRSVLFMHQNGLQDEAFDAWRYSNYDYRKGHRPDRMLLLGMLFGITNRAIRNDPRFMDLCEQLGLCSYWVATGRWPDCVAEVAHSYDLKAESLKRVAASA